MGMENTRTLKNINFNGKKKSKKSSKKNRKDPSTTEEMRNLLDQETENNNFSLKNKGLVQYDEQVPNGMYNGMHGMQQMPNAMQQMPNAMHGMPNAMQQMPNMSMMNGLPNMNGMPNMTNMQAQAFTPGSYNPLLLQQMAPVSTGEMPSNLMSAEAVAGQMAQYARGPMPNMASLMPQGMMGGGKFNIMNLAMLSGTRQLK